MGHVTCRGSERKGGDKRVKSLLLTKGGLGRGTHLKS